MRVMQVAETTKHEITRAKLTGNSVSRYRNPPAMLTKSNNFLCERIKGGFKFFPISIIHQLELKHDFTTDELGPRHFKKKAIFKVRSQKV